MIKEHIPYYEHLAFEDWTCNSRSARWKQYLRLRKNMRRLIAASLLSLTVNVILLGVIIL